MASPAVVEITPRERILDAAERLFARRGYSGVGLSEVAETVGLGKSSLFHHFQSKHQLYAAVVQRILVDIDAKLSENVERVAGPERKLDAWVDTLIEVLGANPTYARLLLRSLFDNEDLGGELEEEREVNVILVRILNGVTAVLRDGMSRSVFRNASLSHTLQSLVGLIVYHFASGDFGAQLFRASMFEEEEVRRRKEEIKRLLHDGLLAQRAGAGEGDT